MIYITGDTHGEFARFENKKMANRGLNLTEEDYVIVCGDFGLCWSKDRAFSYYCDFFSNKPYTVLWVQGNHENYDMIREYDLEKWHGGKVRHIVRDKVILLERGQVFTIDGKTIFTFGGASSHDIQGGLFDLQDPDLKDKIGLANCMGLPFRIIGLSWWKEELPDKKEMEEGLRNLKKVGNQVDYIITHCCGTKLQESLGHDAGQNYKPDVLTDYLEKIEGMVNYKHWYFGHYHDDKVLDEKHTLLYQEMILLDNVDGNFKRKSKTESPIYHRGDIVKFKCGKAEKCGRISDVDVQEASKGKKEISYHIMCKEEHCAYMYVEETEILCLL